MPYARYRTHFEQNKNRPRPVVRTTHGVPAEAQAALLQTLQTFQLGETGEGRIAHQVRQKPLRAMDDDYLASIPLFVAEEGKHARILGDMVRACGAETLKHAWTESLFRRGRQLIGVRLKLSVLLAAEVIATVFYPLVASALDDGDFQRALSHITDDEQAHLAFHATFFHRHFGPTGRRLFCAFFFLLAWVACLTVLFDHRRTIRVLGIGFGRTARAIHQRVTETLRAVRTGDARPLWPALSNDPGEAFEQAFDLDRAVRAQGHVADFAQGTRLLAVQMQMRAGHREHRFGAR